MEVMHTKRTAATRFIAVCSYSLMIATLTSFIVLPVQATAESRAREQNIAEIVKIVEVEALIRQSQLEWEQITHKRMEQVRAQLNPYMSSMSRERKLQFDAAIDKYVSTVTTSYSSADAAAAWGKVFAANFSDEELRRVVELSHKPFGAKLLKASVAASNQWNTNTRNARMEINDAAYRQLLVEVKPILDAIAQPLQPTAN
jgi:hypothetical protein